MRAESRCPPRAITTIPETGPTYAPRASRNLSLIHIFPLELLSDFDNSWYHRDDDYNYYSGTVAELLEIATGKTNAENARGSFARKVGRALLLEMEIAGLIEEIEAEE